MNFREFLQDRTVVLDGAMGTMLQKATQLAGTPPDPLSITRPDLIEDIHLQYLEAGADVLTTNTFGANGTNAGSFGVQRLVRAAVTCADGARRKYQKHTNRPIFIAQSIGPIGQLLAPSGSLSFEEAYGIYQEQVLAGVSAGADIFLIETQTDLLEAKCAVLACKENADLPVLVTMSFEDSGRTFTGTDPLSMAVTLEGLGIDALGLNCSCGTEGMKPLVEKLLESTRLPILVQPNAGLPGMGEEGPSDEEFSRDMKEFVKQGVQLIGGCCGTTPEMIRTLRRIADTTSRKRSPVPLKTRVASFAKTVGLGEGVRVAGERINPTGKEILQKQLQQGSLAMLLREAVLQAEEGADLLDVNVGGAGVNEASLLPRAVQEIQRIVDTPLLLDSADVRALEAAARTYNGKPLINSVNGTEESMSAVLPLVKKYGACVLALPLDEAGIPAAAEGRVRIAKKILERALSIGIPKENILVDGLVLTVSTGRQYARITLDTVRRVKEDPGLGTALGISNISFGLPHRSAINRSFLQMALAEKVDLVIINPGDALMMETIAGVRVLSGEDPGAAEFIQKYGDRPAPIPADSRSVSTLLQGILRGSTHETEKRTRLLLQTEAPLQVVENHLLPALQTIGEQFEAGTLYLPQLLRASETAKRAFALVKEAMRDAPSETKNSKVILATVQHDVHDIGKNIVKVVMENYGFDVYDLGKDVAPERVLQACRETGATFVGLSALMTTTVPSMKKTIALLKKEWPGVFIVVGGAVLNERYAMEIGADRYVRYPTDTAKAAQRYFEKK